MNKISKELRQQIAKKVYHTFGQKDDIDVDKATAKYRPRIKEIAKLHQEYESKTEELSADLKAEGLHLDTYNDRFKIEPNHFPHSNEVDEVIEQVIVKLQYSKDPDFLSSVDKLIQSLVPKQQKVENIS